MSRVDTMQNVFAEIDGFANEVIEEHRKNFDGNNVNDFIDAFLLEQKVAGEYTSFTGISLGRY